MEHMSRHVLTFRDKVRTETKSGQRQDRDCPSLLERAPGALSSSNGQKRKNDGQIVEHGQEHVGSDMNRGRKDQEDA